MPNTQPKQPNKESIVQKTIKKLENDISAGTYRVGEKMPTEQALMQLYQIGRSSLREALKTLQTLGIITIRQGSGIFINENVGISNPAHYISSTLELKQINDTRILLEKELLQLAIRYRDQHNLIEIKTALDSRKYAVMNQLFQMSIDADIQFHIAIANAAHNKTMADLYKIFTIQLREYLCERDHGNTSHLGMVHGLHEVLYQCILTRNEETGLCTLHKLLDNNYWQLAVKHTK